jgi:hypothetical protein
VPSASVRSSGEHRRGDDRGDTSASPRTLGRRPDHPASHRPSRVVPDARAAPRTQARRPRPSRASACPPPRRPGRSGPAGPGGCRCSWCCCSSPRFRCSPEQPTTVRAGHPATPRRPPRRWPAMAARRGPVPGTGGPWAAVARWAATSGRCRQLGPTVSRPPPARRSRLRTTGRPSPPSPCTGRRRRPPGLSRRTAGLLVRAPSVAPVVAGYHEAGHRHGLELAPVGELLAQRNTTRVDAPGDDPDGPRT